MKHQFELTAEVVETIADVLEYAEDEAVTSTEHARIRQARREFVSQWANEDQ